MEIKYCKRITALPIFLILAVQWETTVGFPLRKTKEIKVQSFFCPHYDPIRYLGCYCDSPHQKLDCIDGTLMTQQALDDFLMDIYYLNNPTADSKLLIEIPLLRILNTRLKSLSLDRLLGFHFNILHISNNQHLTEITGPNTNVQFKEAEEEDASPSLPLLKINELIFVANNNSQQLDLTRLLKLSADSIKTVVVHSTAVQEQFLEGLKTLKNVETLHLQGNNITLLPSGFISSEVQLKSLRLDENRIKVLPQKSLTLFPTTTPELETETLYINLTANKLRNQGISPQSGLASMIRPTVLDLSKNNFVYITEDRFKGFLHANKKNTLLLEKNSFICNSKMKWLKDGKSLYESRVKGVVCTNDPEHTIFTTSLV